MPISAEKNLKNCEKQRTKALLMLSVYLGSPGQILKYGPGRRQESLGTQQWREKSWNQNKRAVIIVQNHATPMI